jgi:hypothetical protein
MSTSGDLGPVGSQAFATTPRPGRPVRPAGGQRAALLVLAVLAVVVAVLLATFRPTASAADDWPPSGSTTCTTVTLLAGQHGTPYYEYAQTLAARLKAAPEGWEVSVQETAGSAQNLRRLGDTNGSGCALALTQLSTAVDADTGVNQFRDATGKASKIAGLRTIGPIHDDLLHVVVNIKGTAMTAPVTSVADLCNQKVAVGEDDSGTQQIAQVLLRAGLPAACNPFDDPGSPLLDRSKLLAALLELRRGAIAAVIWAGGPATAPIVEAMRSGQIRLLDLSGLRDPMQTNWDDFYRRARPTSFYPGSVYPLDGFGLNDYPGISYTPTIALPNAIVGTADTDPQLVRRTVAALFADQGAYVRALWGTNPAGRSVPDAVAVYESPFYCFVQLHPAAVEYYVRVLGRPPGCGRRVR